MFLLNCCFLFGSTLLQSGVWGYVEDYHEKGCSAETEYSVSTSFPWNKLPTVLPKFHLTVTDVAFIIHNDRFRVYRSGRKSSAGLAEFVETGSLEQLRNTVGTDGYILKGMRDSSSSETTPVFTTNVTVTFARRFLTVVGRVDKTPDWFVASTSQDLCNQEPYFSEITQEWKLGDYQDLLLLDVGTFITPTQRNARPRPIKPISYNKDIGYTVTKNDEDVSSVGVVDARRRACPVFGTSAYSVGQEWRQGPCTHCKCLDTNKDVCTREVCPPPSCEYFVFQPDVCCPVCQDRSDYLKIVEKTRNPDPPVIVKKPGNVTVPLGGSFTLDCTAWGDPAPQIQLLRNRPEDFVHVHLDPVQDVKPGLSRASLKIDVMTEDRVGRYTCFVNSIGGSREEHAHVILK
ncbi:uncharacterized protein LOC134812103 [Bolinopsis microptera]|uniref:uncharacterized protein LOC134812103 n=1 Tax=Bolinopsis microptera TaxID=2820187 RepID=UPI003079C762